ncbi:MAG: DUF1059 domain-containing protein [Streptosporangiales bacterium]|nr:DUF1059 domain-containing protein [Streptosporangiales bacterium]
MTRVLVDCRTIPSESNCSLTIAGSEDEVVRAAVQHSIDVHGHDDTPELHEQVRGALQPATEQISRQGAFVQMIEFTAHRQKLDEGKALLDKWEAEIGDARTARWSVLTIDKDREDRYVQLVEFPSYEEAMANSEHPATAAFAESLTELAEDGPTFRNLDVVTVDL